MISAKHEGEFYNEKTSTIILLFVLSCLLILSGCNNTNGILNSSVTEKNEYSVPNGEYEESGSDNTGISSQVQYMSFEDTLATATDIMVATYTGRTERHGIYYDLEFTPVKQVKGTRADGNVHVRICEQSVSVVGTDIQYLEEPNRYVAGANYVLVLKKHISVYNPYDLYIPLNNILIENGESPTMYDDSFVGIFSTSIIEESSFEGILKYIEDFQLKGIDVSQVNGYDYIRSTNLTDIVTLSSMVVEVVPVQLLGVSENNDTERFLCNITNSLKGNILEGKIKIVFFADAVDIGSTYTVLIEPLGDSEYYILSSKNSLYANARSTSESIKAIIQSSSKGKKD